MDTSRAVDRRRVRVLLGLGVAALVTLALWALLVYAAIGFGHDARSGESMGWLFLGISAVGAVACLVLALILGVRIVALARGTASLRARGGGHRAG